MTEKGQGIEKPDPDAALAFYKQGGGRGAPGGDDLSRENARVGRARAKRPSSSPRLLRTGGEAEVARGAVPAGAALSVWRRREEG